MQSADVVVIGGGLAGCATAYHLAGAGVATILAERGALNRAASGTNAGSLHFQLRRHDQLSRPRAELILGGLAEWRSIAAEFKDRIGMRMAGGLMVAETPGELSRLHHKVADERELGLTSQVVTGRELADLAPALAPELAGAAYCAEEGSVNPLLATMAFASGAIQSGAQMLTGCDVRGISLSGRRGYLLRTSAGSVHAARVVNAAGAMAGRVARQAGLSLPISGKVQIVSATARQPIQLTQLVQHTAKPLTLKQTTDGTFLIGGGWAGAVDGTRTRPRWESIAGNAFLACRVVPALRTATLLRSWTGTIAITPDRLPVAGESRRLPGWFNLVVPRGAAGYTVTPYLARRLAQHMTGREPALPYAFSPDRWTSHA